MELDKEIALQIDRIKTLEKEVLNRKASASDAKRPAKMQQKRAETIRGAIADLRKRREATIARFDAEIEGYEAELKDLANRPDLDLGGVRAGKSERPVARQPRRGE